MNTQKLIRSGVANDTGKLRPSLQHGLEAALSVSDSMIDEVLVQSGFTLAQIEGIAVTVLASVTGRRPEQGQLVIDAGGLALSKDRSTSSARRDYGFGHRGRGGLACGWG